MSRQNDGSPHLLFRARLSASTPEAFLIVWSV